MISNAPINLVVFGSGAVGKSAMTLRYTCGNFIEDYDPTIEDQYSKDITIDNVTYKCEILDTAGEEEFIQMRLPYIRKGNAFLLVYSITFRQSFDEIEHLHRDILHNKGTTDVPIVICGNKCDLEDNRIVSKSEGEVLAQQLKCPFMETSAKTEYNITNAFQTALREYIKRVTPVQNHTQQEEPKKFRCILV
ncbi:small GTP-binding protein, putative [Trichomonas vaginalis G3]|uniref:small monomeric GTPase n=1 Tax=Trichomonas vaginalis (strain ATCC PRA-98 / G3) TaxID=412133 RepID=A2G1N8_TRIV3|nr:GTPase protein [Trichomonas vaginalis G3]EAX88924.1 small GTP-binding protein, putative [Trichomonas vaginalis G3]KAI5512493.1 GTPase protein [Trichomonas vaginalis G3]|eukprot:XP_001301854.1 small GTP-binding protein [Trichomonas vaginalis G3]